MREYNSKTWRVFVHQHITQEHLAPDGLHITRKDITFSSTHTRQTLVKPYELLFFKLPMPVELHPYDYFEYFLIISSRPIIKGTSASFVCVF